jgi:SNF2 family DNA or RNA helicase
MTVLVSAKHEMLGVTTTPQLKNLFPHARELGALLAIPHGIDETKMLRNLGIDAPAPVLSQYDWNGGDPFDIQQKTVAMLTTEQRAYVLNDMGTGKTKCAIWAFDYLRSKGLARKMLVVAPLSTLTFVWAREVLFTAPHLKVAVLHHTDRKKRVERLKADWDIAVINHDGVDVILPELYAMDIDVLVLDELAAYRNWNMRTKKMARLAKRFRWVWGMTGSPTPNSPVDVWGQALVVTPNRVDNRFTRFRDELMIKVSTFKYVAKNDATERAFLALQPAVRFTMDDVVELPEVVYRTIQVAMGPGQQKIYEALRIHAHALVQNKEITAANAGAVLQKLLQVSLGWVYSGSKKDIVPLDNIIRLQALDDIIASTNRKLIVFAPFKHALAGLTEYLNKQGHDTAPAVSGDTSQSERNTIFSAFQGSSKYKVLPAHPACMSHGLTLTAADTIAWFGPITSLETFSQANARITRIGQHHRQQIIMLQSTAVERKIYAILQAKQDVQEKLLEMFEEAS